MKTPFSKFLMLSVVLVLVLSGLQGDSGLFCQGQVKAESGFNMNEGQVLVAIAEEKLQDQEEKKKPAKTFDFPNVFDALRFIF